MPPTTFEDIYHRSACILGEGGLIERLRRNSPFELDPFIVNSGFIYEEPKRKAIESIYRQYLDKKLGTRILGGCCGTDQRHINDLAARLAGA